MQFKIAQLYGLNEEEMRIIRGEKSPP